MRMMIDRHVPVPQSLGQQQQQAAAADQLMPDLPGLHLSQL